MASNEVLRGVIDPRYSLLDGFAILIQEYDLLWLDFRNSFYYSVRVPKDEVTLNNDFLVDKFMQADLVIRSSNQENVVFLQVHYWNDNTASYLLQAEWYIFDPRTLLLFPLR